MKFSTIHHIAIIVSDYEKSRDFYVNKLGFSVIRENYRPDRGDWKLDLRINDTTELEIFGVSNPPKTSDQTGGSRTAPSGLLYGGYRERCERAEGKGNFRGIDPAGCVYRKENDFFCRSRWASSGAA